jgi:2-methylisocitrate lyase-like PEP mutase family enzyme
VSLRSERLREVLRGPGCLPAAPIFDPLSARIAEMSGWRVCKLAGSVAKATELCLPDGVPLSNATDIVEICRRINRVIETSLMVDVDDAGETPLQVYRLVRDLEEVDVAAIEIEDNLVPRELGSAEGRHSQLIPTAEQVDKLKTALAARRDTSTVIIARTSALSELPLPDALRRIEAYAGSGVDALMLPGIAPKTRSIIEAVHEVTDLPLCVVGLTQEMIEDRDYLERNAVRIRYFGQPVYGMAVKTIHDSLEHLKAGGRLEELDSLRAKPELLNAITRSGELAAWSRAHPFSS